MQTSCTVLHQVSFSVRQSLEYGDLYNGLPTFADTFNEITQSERTQTLKNMVSKHGSRLELKAYSLAVYLHIVPCCIRVAILVNSHGRFVPARYFTQQHGVTGESCDASYRMTQPS